MEQAPAVNWNDDRLDRLADQVDGLNQRIDDLRVHMDERFEKQDARIDAKFESFEARIDARFNALQRSLTITLAGILVAFVGLLGPTVF
jgi:flagellar biosynthesis/type III secretory pathway protein FliH